MNLDRFCTYGALLAFAGMAYTAYLDHVEQAELDSVLGPQPVHLYVAVPACDSDGDYVCTLDRAQRIAWNGRN